MRGDLNVISSEQVMELLNNWYIQMREENLEKVAFIKRDVAEKITRMEKNQTLLLYYSLLEFRYKLLLENVADLTSPLEKTNPEELDNLLAYYYYFFQGMYEYNLRNYYEALSYYKLAEKKLETIGDEIEKAEFHHKVAWTFSYTRQILLAIQHILKAKEIFDKYENYKHRQADCENLLGICWMIKNKFKESEEHFNNALSLTNMVKHNTRLRCRITYNLGLLYSEQNLSELAIDHLSCSYNMEKNYRTLYALAREYFKVGKNQEAINSIQEGVAACNKLNNEEYLHHFNILNVLSANAKEYEIQQAFQEGIAYFQKKKIWGFVKDYAEKFAYYFCQNRQYQKACTYYQLALEANNKTKRED